MSRRQRFYVVRCGIPNANMFAMPGHNLKITLEYDGTNYSGWQVQTRHAGKTIQQALEKTLGRILRERIKVIGSGRTDAGVHALGQVANFHSRCNIPPDKLQSALNSLLPKDIAAVKIEEVRADFHSRFCTKTKVYRYAILNRPYRSAFSRNNSYFYSYPLNLKLMQREAGVLLGKHDFKAFCASGSNVKDTIRTIKKIVIKKNVQCSEFRVQGFQGGLITIDIEADGFLYNMVRNIAGTLIEIGRGKFPEGSIKRVLHSKNRKLAGPTAPACGLTLLKVKY